MDLPRSNEIKKTKKAKKTAMDCKKCTMIFFNEEIFLEHTEESYKIVEPFYCDECDIFSSCTDIGKVIT